MLSILKSLNPVSQNVGIKQPGSKKRKLIRQTVRDQQEPFNKQGHAGI